MPLLEMNVQCCIKCDKWLTTERARIKCPSCNHLHEGTFAMLRLFTRHFTPFRFLGRSAGDKA